MRKADFEKFYAKITDEVRSLREVEKYDNDGVRCWLIGYITSGTRSYTSAQLKKVFDMGFENEKAPGAGKQSGTKEN